MSYYDNVQYGSRAILVEQGWPVYLFGSRNSDLSTSYVTSVAVQSNVATVGIAAFSGPFPAVGQIATIRGTQTAAGAFNVTNAVLTGVTLNPAGVGTVTFGLVASDVANGDAGTINIVSSVTGETIAAGASAAGTPTRVRHEYAYNIFCDIQFPTIPTAVTVKFQTAMRNIDSDFADAATVATVTAGAITQKQANFVTTAPFFRLAISGLTGTGTIAGMVVI